MGPTGDPGRPLSRPDAVVATGVGPAAVRIERPTCPAAGLLVLGHGAGGGVDAPDLSAATAAGLAAGWAVARVTQPYRVAGRRSPPPPPRLDAAWSDVLSGLRRRRGLPTDVVVLGGRSSGARVACRTAAAAGAAGVLALAFPLRPPGRTVDRGDELAGVGVPVYVVQGERDAFGSAVEVAAVANPWLVVHPVAGADHALRTAVAREAVEVATAELLAAVTGGSGGRTSRPAAAAPRR